MPQACHYGRPAKVTPGSSGPVRAVVMRRGLRVRCDSQADSAGSIPVTRSQSVPNRSWCGRQVQTTPLQRGGAVAPWREVDAHR